jgi:alginate O-acetyltransferase complex protein AlgI
MLFYSPRFFIFLFVLLLVLAVHIGHERKKHVLAIASCLFYAAWDFRYLGLLLLVSFIDYWCAARIEACGGRADRKRYLLFSIVSNLTILAYFKYTNFFLANLNGLLPASAHLPHLDILLPAGISFYTFKSMSYTIDVFRKEITPCTRAMDYVTFVTFFPDLIAGPIVRASVFLPQMIRAIGPTRTGIRHGVSLFLLGLTKKVVVADTLGRAADSVFKAPEAYATLSLWMGLLAYTIQIYCDFSGYSDMAIGTAKMIGYDLPENFNMPYVARNPADFWRRWHITLSQWLRDYLYISLGGNRRGPVRTYVNLFITMLLGGLWHGASWNFVLWGGLHGVALAVHRAWAAYRLPAPPALLAQVLMFVFVTLCWVPFRAVTTGDCTMMFKGLFGMSEGNIVFLPAMLFVMVAIVVAGHVVILALDRKSDAAALRSLLRFFDAEYVIGRVSGRYVALGISTVPASFLLAAWALLVLSLAAFRSQPFIYFQF